MRLFDTGAATAATGVHLALVAENDPLPLMICEDYFAGASPAGRREIDALTDPAWTRRRRSFGSHSHDRSQRQDRYQQQAIAHHLRPLTSPIFGLNHLGVGGKRLVMVLGGNTPAMRRKAAFTDW